MNATDHPEAYAWWNSLKHHGLLIVPCKLIEFFPKEPPPLAPTVEDRLPRALTQLGGGDAEADTALWPQSGVYSALRHVGMAVGAARGYGSRAYWACRGAAGRFCASSIMPHCPPRWSHG